MKKEKYSNEIKFSHFDDGLLRDREIYISRKPNDKVSIALEDGQSYSYIEMTTQECAEMLIDFSNFINKK